MPVEYSADHVRRRIAIRITGAFVLTDVFAIAQRHEAMATWDYDTLYDLRDLLGAPTQSDLSQAADYVQRLVGSRPRGRVAIVSSAAEVVHAIQVYDALNKGGLRVRAFDSIAEAERWLLPLEPGG